MNDKRVMPWERRRFQSMESDPLTGFANIMDVMLVFALGLIIALIAQSKAMKQHFKFDLGVEVRQGRELVEAPEAIKKTLANGSEGMQSLGTVYRDPKTGKLILIDGNDGNDGK